MLALPNDATVVFVSDSHIGGDPGCDGFESPEEMRALFRELAALPGPVELVLAGDFFDFLQIGPVPDGEDRASLTVGRPEYAPMFEALRAFGEGEDRRIIYLPGNHDAEVWWNPRVQRTLREGGLVHDFAFYYAARFGVEGGTRVVYCEHGNQLDPPNTVEDYADPLDTPLGHHVVTDFTRRIAPLGEVAPGLDLAEIKMVYPLVAIPRWIAGRYFYDFVGKVVRYLLLPILALYVVYRVAAYALAVSNGDPNRLIGASRELPRVHELFVEIGGFALLVLLLFALFFVVIRTAVRRTLGNLNLARAPKAAPKAAPEAAPRATSPAEVSREKVRGILLGGRPPMAPEEVRGEGIDVFVSGHTHLPSLEVVERPGGRGAVAVNSGCFLRQLHPVAARFGGPPVFVSEFVLTHARVYASGGELRAELWEHPKPAEGRLSPLERLLSWGRRPPQPPAGAPARVRNAESV